MELFNKISQYNIFNFLLPGVIFCTLVKQLWELDIAGVDLIVATFVYYFVGMCVSRIGSLVVEPLLKAIRLVSFSNYGDFLNAEAVDPKLEELLSTANFYRSILGCLLSFLTLSFGLWLISIGKISHSTLTIVVVASIIALTLQGYRKQVSYINKRVAHRKEKNADS